MEALPGKAETPGNVLTTRIRLRLQATLRRLAAGYSVSLQELIDLQTYADQDQTVAAWLRRARHRQNKRMGGSSKGSLQERLQPRTDAFEMDFEHDPDDPNHGFGSSMN